MFASGCVSVCARSGIRSSLVQLEAAAEGLKFTTNTSPGKILGGWRLRHNLLP